MSRDDWRLLSWGERGSRANERQETRSESGVWKLGLGVRVAGNRCTRGDVAWLWKMGCSHERRR